MSLIANKVDLKNIDIEMNNLAGEQNEQNNKNIVNNFGYDNDSIMDEPVTNRKRYRVLYGIARCIFNILIRLAECCR
ncbi:hypothetical protein DERP_011382 [Dermatophagoides pteronyssinus]|uniref:Uncharacterized protein n=1 Tax=Dermatophagoides pteronyssinus TaxID=6956 RepID=A0ABQ8J5A5_DERPT|nr:hypothetical protein DERP_011382 [Dermatophagoides pteronyssinus]